MTIDPRGMTLERALEIASATLPVELAPARLTPDRAARLRELHAQGLEDPELAAALGLGRRYVSTLRRELGLPSNFRRPAGYKPAPRTSTECVRGHPRTPENTYTRPDGKTKCRACSRELERRTKTTNQKADNA